MTKSSLSLPAHSHHGTSHGPTMFLWILVFEEEDVEDNDYDDVDDYNDDNMKSQSPCTRTAWCRAQQQCFLAPLHPGLKKLVRRTKSCFQFSFQILMLVKTPGHILQQCWRELFDLQNKITSYLNLAVVGRSQQLIICHHNIFP